MKIPLIALIFQGIPEQIAVVTLAFVLAKIRLEWKKIVLFGLILASSAYIIRLFPITFGVHTIVIIGLLFVLLVNYCNATIENSLSASLISFLILIVLETTFLFLFSNLLEVNLGTLNDNILLRELVSLPQIVLLLFIAFLVNKVQTVKGIK